MLVLRHVHAAAAKAHALQFEAGALLHARFVLELDLAARAYDALPGEGIAAALQQLSHVPMVQGIARRRGHLAVSGYFAAGNLTDGLPECRVALFAFGRAREASGHLLVCCLSHFRTRIPRRAFDFAHWRSGCYEECGGNPMNWDQMEGQWKQMKGKMKEKWGKLTDSDWDQVAGKRDQFLGKLQERYGYSKEQADRELTEWERAQGRPSKVA